MDSITHHKHIDENYIDDTYMINNGTYTYDESNSIVSIGAIIIIVCTSLYCSYRSSQYFICEFMNRNRRQTNREQLTREQLIRGQLTRGQTNRGQLTRGQLKEYLCDNINNDNNDCCICLDKFNENDELIVLKCNHRFHTKCIINWFEKELTCPLCRKKVEL